MCIDTIRPRLPFAGLSCRVLVRTLPQLARFRTIQLRSVHRCVSISPMQDGVRAPTVLSLTSRWAIATVSAATSQYSVSAIKVSTVTTSMSASVPTSQRRVYVARRDASSRTSFVLTATVKIPTWPPRLVPMLEALYRVLPLLSRVLFPVRLW